MGATSNTPANAAADHHTQHDASTTLGVGGPTSGEASATPTHESQAETGGSGGAQLTHSQGEVKATPDGKQAAAPGAADAGPDAGPSADAVDSAMQTGARGAQDTRAGQGGGTGTGLGSRESGANQSAQDLPPR